MFIEHSHNLSIAHRSKNARRPTGSQHQGGGLYVVFPYFSGSESRCACSTCQFPRRETGIIATCHSQVNSPPSLCSGEQSMFSLSSVACAPLFAFKPSNMSNLNSYLSNRKALFSGPRRHRNTLANEIMVVGLSSRRIQAVFDPCRLRESFI